MPEYAGCDARIGCCGFAGARSRYFNAFRLVEIQQTFYDPPQVKTAEKWRAEAPADFEFTVKAWQLITHPATSPTYRRLRRPLAEDRRRLVGGFQVTKPVIEAWDVTARIARVLRARMILFQCPASFTPSEENIANMRRFFRTIPREDFLFAWEPRGDWDDPTVRSLCRELRLIHSVDPFSQQAVTDTPFYFRMHGIGGYRYIFTEKDLQQLHALCRGLCTCYFLFNNLTMFQDASGFRQMVGRPVGAG